MVIFDDRKWKPEIEKQEIELQLLCSNTVELIERLRESRLKKESISSTQEYLLKNFKFLKEEIDKYEKMCVKTKYL